MTLVGKPLPVDRAANLSRQYLDAIRLHLKPTMLHTGEAMIFPDEITPTSVRDLARDLRDVVGGNAGDDARIDTRACGNDHVQAVAFGTIRDFTTSIKVGLLYSRRVVLWDILSLICEQVWNEHSRHRIPHLKLATPNRDYIAEVASNVLALQALVDAGAAVVLEHPTEWSEAATRAQQRAAAGHYGVFYSTHLGVLLAAAQAVAKELNVHPYNLHDYATPLPAPEDLSLFMSRQNQLLQKSYGQIVANTAFGYLDDLSIKQFFELTREYPRVAYELQNVIGELSGRTEQQWSEQLSHAQSRIEEAVAAQNARLSAAKQLLEVGGPVAGAVATLLGLQGVIAIVGPAAEAGGAAIPSPSITDGHYVAFFTKAQHVAVNNFVALPTGEPL